MKILVTGGAGFIGSNFIHHMLETYPDYSIVNLDKLTYAGNLNNHKHIKETERYTFVQGDIADQDLMDKLIQEVDVVVNYAAETHVDRSILNPKGFIETDVLGSYTLLEACRKHGIERYIQISTDEVYGDIEEGTFNEESPFRPNSPYSASKAGGDHMVRAYVQTYGIPAIVSHCCNVMGPYQHPEKFIPLFTTNLLEGKKVPLYGDGSNVREWIHVKDHCLATDLLIHKGKIGEEYCIGTGDEMTNLDMTNLMIELTGRDQSFIEHVKDRLGHDVRYAIDSSKIRSELGWAPTMTFEEGFKDTVEWYKNNEDWWKPLKEGEFKDYYKENYGKE